MTIKIQEVEDTLKHEELDFFIKGNISLEKSSRVKPFNWIPDQGWEDIIKLSEISPDVFGSLPSDVEKSEKAWKDVCVFVCMPHTQFYIMYSTPVVEISVKSLVSHFFEGRCINDCHPIENVQ